MNTAVIAIAEAEKRVARQAALVEEMKSLGLSATGAEQLLGQLQAAVLAYRAEYVRLANSQALSIADFRQSLCAYPFAKR
jgi:hypothetical protein